MLAVLVYGAVLVYLLGVVPAMFVCAAKGQFAMLFAGFLTFGLVWWVGAGAGSSRRTRVIAVAVLLCGVLALGDVGARPGQFVGVDGHALQGSVGGHGWLGADSCGRLSDDEWSCERWSNQASGDISYRIRVGHLGCWHGVKTERHWPDDPDRIAGCVHLDDFFF